MLKYFVIYLILISLFWSIIHYCAAYFEQILGYILGLARKIAWFCFNIEAFPVLFDHGIELQRLSAQGVFIDELQLVKYIYKIYLIWLLDLVL